MTKGPERDQYRAIIPPIYQTTIYAQESPGVPSGHEYSRVSNPTREALESELAETEKSKYALAFSSGSAAASALLLGLSSGDHIVCSQDIYEGTYRILDQVMQRFDVKTDFVDFDDMDSVKGALREDTKLVFYETVSNPLLKVTETKDVVDVVKGTGSGAAVVVDNTFASPICKQPLLDGADVVLHSLTKYINGHHDVTGGALFVNDDSLYDGLHSLQYTLGIQLSPGDCSLVSRGLKTLELRMRKHEENAKEVSAFLASNNFIKNHAYPGFSGMVSFWVDGDGDETKRALERLQRIKIAHSLGGFDTTVQHPRSMMSFSESSEELDRKGITDNLVRMSVGLEDSLLLIADLEQALAGDSSEE